MNSIKLHIRRLQKGMQRNWIQFKPWKKTCGCVGVWLYWQCLALSGECNCWLLSLSLSLYIYIYIIYSIFPLTPLYSELFLLVLPFRRFSSFPSLMLQPFQETILQNTSWYGAEFSQYFDMDPNAGKVHSFLTYRITLCWSIN